MLTLQEIPKISLLGIFWLHCFGLCHFNYYLNFLPKSLGTTNLRFDKIILKWSTRNEVLKKKHAIPNVGGEVACCVKISSKLSNFDLLLYNYTAISSNSLNCFFTSSHIYFEALALLLALLPAIYFCRRFMMGIKVNRGYRSKIISL